jgi:hypothetical protein
MKHPKRTFLLLAALFALSALLSACSDELSVPTDPLRLLRLELPVAFLGEAFDAPLRPSGGLRPYSFSLRDGALPAGIELSGGSLRGVPLEVGRFEATIAVRDGNLSQDIQRIALEVRPLPTPVLRLDAPGTELREPINLSLRVEDARGWLGARVAIKWDPSSVEWLGFDTAPGMALISESPAPGLALLEFASLMGARRDSFLLSELRFAPINEAPVRLSLELESVSRYTGGDHYSLRREGAPPTRPLGPLKDDEDEPAENPEIAPPQPAEGSAEPDSPDDDPDGSESEADL